MTNEKEINHPTHYNLLPSKCLKCRRPIECVDVAEQFNFNLGNAIKYIWRAGLKGDAEIDLLKAAWYLNREICKRSEEGEL